MTPVDPRVRLAITQWPPDAPRGEVTTFCAEHGISRKTFYVIKKRSELEGQAAALQPRTRRPSRSPNRTVDEVKKQAIGVRAALEQSGLGHGPISVHEKMRVLGMTPVPSTASLSRIFRNAGVVRVEPRKKPRASFRRYVCPAPNACWQLDGTEYVVTAGRKCVIFQLIDDHSRLAVASHVAWGETSEGALAVVKRGIKAHGVPQRLLTDNGAALNPSRRGAVGHLVTYVTRLGVEAITGKPYKPTSQGKNERFHQTLFRWLDKQPPASSLEQLQEQVDRFDEIYNTERPHQGLPGRITPEQAWEATPKADPPRPRNQMRPVGWDAIRRAAVAANGIAQVRQTRFHVTRLLAGQNVYLIETDQHLLVFDDQGAELMQHRWPKPGNKYVRSGRPRGPQPRML